MKAQTINMVAATPSPRVEDNGKDNTDFMGEFTISWSRRISLPSSVFVPVTSTPTTTRTIQNPVDEIVTERLSMTKPPERLNGVQTQT